jgi:catechol-2,3-dioxygenase
MRTLLKAIVFKTSRLRETQAFFETTLGLKTVESSITHFVVYAKGIRILFIESESGLEVEFYFTKKSAEGLTVQEDPNQIKIIIS